MHTFFKFEPKYCSTFSPRAVLNPLIFPHNFSSSNYDINGKSKGRGGSPKSKTLVSRVCVSILICAELELEWGFDWLKEVKLV